MKLKNKSPFIYSTQLNFSFKFVLLRQAQPLLGAVSIKACVDFRLPWPPRSHNIMQPLTTVK